MEKQYDYLIVGSGLFGSVFAFEAAKRGKKCLVLERRDHIAGNIYCEKVFHCCLLSFVPSLLLVIAI